MSQTVNTIINVNKPQGWTSFDVVRALKKLLQEKKAGHLGTLDPLATGVLPVFLGKATKLISLFNDLDKTYRATVKLGERTDTWDAEGKILEQRDTRDLTTEQVTQAILSYQGTQQQQVPFYSAVKYLGVPSYRLAREGKTIVPKYRTIHIKRIVLDQLALPWVTFTVQCSKGTYIRSLAEEIGQALQVGAYLSALERLACGTCFSWENAYTMQALHDLQQSGSLSAACMNPVNILSHLTTVFIDEKAYLQLIHGQSIVVDVSLITWVRQSSLAKALNDQGELIALGRLEIQTPDYHFFPSKLFIEGGYVNER